MTKLNLLLFNLLFLLNCFSQVGINTNDPKTTLDINGAITNREISFTLTNNNAVIDLETSLANIIGTSNDVITITSYTPKINGHRLIIFNNTIGGNDAFFYGMKINNGTAYEFIFSNQTWKQLAAAAIPTILNGNQMITNVADLGILPDGKDYSNQIRSVIETAKGAPLFFPAGKYVYDGNIVTTSRVNIIGVMPIFTNDTLQNGTIFLNKLHFTGTHISVKGLGVQLNSNSPNDCFRVTPTINTGKYCRLSDIVTVGANTTSAFHSVLLEGIDYAQVDNIESYNGYMGQVFKIKSGNLTNLRCNNIAKESIFIKSDNTSGNCKNITLSGVQIENTNAGTSTGIKINSAGAQLQNVSISNVNIQKTQFGIAIISSGGIGVAINDLNLNNIRIDGTTLKCIYLEANTGFVYKVNMSNFDLTSVAKSLIETVGSIKFVNISNLHADITSATVQSEKEQIINFGANTYYTNLTNINITKGNNDDPLLAINYQNSANLNRIQNYNVKLRGNVPESGVSNVSSTSSFDLTPVISTINKESYIELTTTNAGTYVNSISKTPDVAYVSEFFKKGYKLFLKNTSSNSIEIKNNIAGNIQNPNGLSIILPSQSIVCYVFDGSYWTQAIASETKRIINQKLDYGDVVLDNIKITIPQNGNKSIQLSTINSDIIANGYSINTFSNSLVDGLGGDATVSSWKVFEKTINSSVDYWQSNLNLLQPGDCQEINLKDSTSNVSYKILFTLGKNNVGHQVKIERLD